MFQITCPCCYARLPLEAALNDDDARTAIAAALRLHPLGRLMINYLALFRPASRATSMARATRLLVELIEAVESGQITRHGRVWAAPRDAWQYALEQVLLQRDQDKLRVPLRDHGYLFEIVASRANAQEAALEARVELERRTVRDAGQDGPRRAGDVAGHIAKMYQAIGKRGPAADAISEQADVDTD